MRIRKLRLTGFKSFVEPAELRIEPGLTGVVGPNGCGKSNLLEAIRWVMGEGSAKSLRGGGMEDVIFAGTERRPPRDFAEVSILVERPVPEGGAPAELEVVRRIERGAGSAYRMDGRDVRARDVALVFADAATGAHSPALVSQNRIGAIISARPAERRAMLEEAAGIAGLHVRRKEAETRLRTTEANLARLDELLGGMEARGATLRRQARAAARYRTLSDAIRVAEARLIWARWRDAAAAAELATAEAARAEAAVSTAGEAQQAAMIRQAEAVRALGAARHAAEGARGTNAAARQRREELAATHAVAVRRLGELERQRAAIVRDRGREDSLAHDAAEVLARLAAEDVALAATIAATEAARPALAERLGKAEREAGAAEAALGQAVAVQAAFVAELRAADAAIAAGRSRLARAQGELARVTREAAGLGDAAPLAAERNAADAQAAQAAESIADAQGALVAGEGARAQAAAARDEAEATGSAARAALTALEAEARALAKAVERAGDARVIAQVRAAPGYERALAAALGDDLDAALGAGARAWTGSAAQADDPALPAGLAALAAYVTAPAALARRLAQIAVTDVDDGIALAVGQRLVTLDGRLRRWDGYVAREAGAAAAERLIRVNRLRAIEADLPATRESVAGAAAAREAAARALADAAAQTEAARRALAAAESARRTALRAIDAATSALERLTLQRAAIDERRARAAAEDAEAAEAVAQAGAARAALPDGTAAADAVTALRTAAHAAQAALAEARAAAHAAGEAFARDRLRRDTARGEAAGWRARAGDAAARVMELTRRAEAIAAEQAALAGRPEALAAMLAAADRARAEAEAADGAARQSEAAAEATREAADAAALVVGEALATTREARAGAAARAEHQAARRTELSRLSGERFQCPAALLPERLAFASDAVGDAAAEGAGHDRLVNERERIGPVNLVAEAELTELETTRVTAQRERDELAEAIAGLRGSIGSLNREGRARLLAAFEAVDGHFRRLFQTLFAGGEAHLALIDSDDPLEAGLEIMAQPPGKRLGSLTLLSGGEQALTAVALIFALFLTNPAPLCVLDEVDAPLDDANIERFCDLLDAMTQETDTRYLIVTHNAVTMSRMHRLFGVTMIERGVSRLVSVDLGAAESLLAAE